MGKWAMGKEAMKGNMYWRNISLFSLCGFAWYFLGGFA